LLPGMLRLGGLVNSLQDPHLPNNQSKMDWRCGSRGRVSALQALSSDFIPTPPKKKKVEAEPDTFLAAVILSENSGLPAFG
jgi:hypothetical protein